MYQKGINSLLLKFLKKKIVRKPNNSSIKL